MLLADWLVDADLAAGRLVDLFPQHDVTAANFDAAGKQKTRLGDLTRAALAKVEEMLS